MTPDELKAHMLERQQKIRAAIEYLQRLRGTIELEDAKLAHLYRLRDAFDAKAIFKKQTGRAGTWKSPFGAHAVITVEDARQCGGYTVAAALRMLRKQEPWATAWRDHSDRALQARYNEARKYWQPLFKELQEILDEIAASRKRLKDLNDSWPDVRHLVREG
jgi:hypothetical protein